MQRLFLKVLLAAGVLAAPAAAARVDPSTLVLRQADVPAGFRVDRADTGLRTNAEESAGEPEVRELFARAGRLTGYEAAFDRGAASIKSRSDVFRRPEGARTLFRWYDREVRKSGMRGLRRAALRIGAEGVVYSGPAPVPFVVVVWRYDRVFAGVVTTGLTRAHTIALARTQQRRIAAAFR